MSDGARPSLLRAVSLGLCLATASLAQANGLAAQRPANHEQEVAAHRALLQGRMQAHAELTALIANPVGHEGALQSLHAHAQHTTTTGASVRIGEHQGEAIDIKADGIYVTPKDATAQRRAEPRDLSRIGITDLASFRARVQKIAHEVSGVPENPAGSSLRGAIGELQRRAQEAAKLPTTLWAHYDVQLLKNHHQAVSLAKDPAAVAPLLAGVEGQHELRVTPNGITLSEGGVGRAMNFVELKRLGLDSPTAIGEKVAARLMSITGATSVDAARAQLANEISDIQMMGQAIYQAGHHQDIALIRQVQRSMGAASPPAIVLAEGNNERLQVASIQNGGGEVIAIVDGQSPGGRHATIPDLARFQIHSLKDLNAAIGDALLKIAPEDLP